ncbi:MAG: hypothetical protein H0T73_05425 [Ardenticatenales bacterium]|nr:hypothetical protein [Ardenticatenales bacterium]
MEKDVKAMSDAEILERIVCLAFYGESQKFETFCQKLREGLPPGTEVALRGSVVTNEKWSSGGPFDHDGPGTSDLDVNLVGKAVLKCWADEYFYIPKVHTKPLNDQCPEAAPALNPLRILLQDLVGRPVNFQASAELLLEARDTFFGQPYFKILCEEKDEEAS